jgi:hypothetical protein
MINDRFDGTQGFAIDGGIKDAKHVFPFAVVLLQRLYLTLAIFAVSP